MFIHVVSGIVYACLQKCIQELQGENQMLEAQIEGTRQDLVQTSRVVQVCSRQIVCMCVCACTLVVSSIVLHAKCVPVLTVCISYPQHTWYIRTYHYVIEVNTNL